MMRYPCFDDSRQVMFGLLCNKRNMRVGKKNIKIFRKYFSLKKFFKKWLSLKLIVNLK